MDISTPTDTLLVMISGRPVEATAGGAPAEALPLNYVGAIFLGASVFSP
jgi:hypothetical protein